MSGHLRQRSAGSWELRYRVDGLVKTATFRGSKRDAAARLRELMVAADRGQHVDKSRVTIRGFVTERVALWEVSPLTRERYNGRADLINRFLGTMPLQRIGTLEIEQWHGKLRACGLGRSTIRHAHQLLARVLDDALRHKLVTSNAAREQPAPPAPPGKRNIPTEDLLGPMLAALRGNEFYAPVAVTIYCGLRRGEILALRWQDLRLDAGEMTISRSLEETKAHGLRFKEPKTDSGRRTISLPGPAVVALREHRQRQLEMRLKLGAGRPGPGALVFPDIDGSPQSPNTFSVRWRRTVVQGGLPRVTWHGLRHVHCSLLLRHGIDLATASKRLGHSRVDVTARVYAHAIAKDDRHAADALESALG